MNIAIPLMIFLSFALYILIRFRPLRFALNRDFHSNRSTRVRHKSNGITELYYPEYLVGTAWKSFEAESESINGQLYKHAANFGNLEQAQAYIRSEKLRKDPVITIHPGA